MKVFIVIVILLLVILLVSQLTVAIATRRTEHQRYTVMEKDGRFEIRHYPSTVMASVQRTGSYQEMSGAGFRILAGYIFGANDQRKKLPMTAPVRMSQDEDQLTMSFVMSSGIDKDSIPAPDHPGISIRESKGGCTASISFRGYASDRIIEEKKKELASLLESKGINHTGEFEFLGYNPPYQLFNRRNEIEVKLPGL